jgi:hypothetical protein
MRCSTTIRALGFAASLFLEPRTILAVPGDFDNDGFVNSADFNILLFNWGSVSAPFGVGRIDHCELNELILNFGNITRTPASGIQVQIDSFNPSPLPGYVANDIAIDFVGQYTGSQLLVELTQGAIYQHPLFNSDAPPPLALVNLFPELAFDTFVANGSAVDGTVNIAGGAINILPTGASGSQFDQARLYTTWFSLEDSGPTNVTDFLTARVTLTDNAQGTFTYIVPADCENPVTASGAIINGQLAPCVPPPGDFDGDCDIDMTDYLTLTANLLTDVSVLTTAQSYLLGDMTLNRQIDGLDFVAFREAFDEFNGVGAFSAMVAEIPEPSAAALAILTFPAVLLWRRAAS